MTLDLAILTVACVGIACSAAALAVLLKRALVAAVRRSWPSPPRPQPPLRYPRVSDRYLYQLRRAAEDEVRMAHTVAEVRR